MTVSIDDARSVMTRLFSVAEDLLDISLQLTKDDIQTLEQEGEKLAEKIEGKINKLEEKLFGEE